MQKSTAPLSFSAAGKVFLLGEYAVLGRRPALVAAVGPRFSIRAFPDGTTSSPFHPDSPAGLLLRSALRGKSLEYRIEFEDPFRGEGGFGASSAQFALLQMILNQVTGAVDARWQSVYRRYRELTAREAVPPSGADVVAQWRGGVTFFDPSEDELFCLDFYPLFRWSDVLVFSATSRPGRKTATHAHLASLAGEGRLAPDSQLMRDLERPLVDGISAVKEGDSAGFGAALSEYARVLSRHGLESREAREDREALSALPGVLGVKGAGAMLTDALVVLMDSHAGSGTRDRAVVLELAERRGLKLVAEGVSSQMGIGAC